MSDGSPTVPVFPIHRLALEVIAEIFDAACEDYKKSVTASMKLLYEAWTPIYEERHARRKPLVTPVTISLVCRAWKEIAYTTPVLWDTVRMKPWMLGIYASTEERLQVYRTASTHLQKWLGRAGHVPLSIKLAECASGCKVDGDESIWGQIISHSRQWRMLDVYCPEESGMVFAKLREVLAQPLPMLEGFYLRPCLYRNMSLDRAQLDVSSTTLIAPKLSQISLFSSIGISALLNRITVFSCLSLDYEVIMDHLGNMDKLVEDCSIAQINMTPDYLFFIPFPASPIQLPCLKEFSLSIPVPNKAFGYIMQSISLPAMQRLLVAGYNIDAAAGSVLKDTMALLHRSALPSLSSLTISISGSLVEGELVNVLSIIPTLEHFELSIMEGEPILSIAVPDISTPLVKLDYLTTFNLICRGQCEDRIPAVKFISAPALLEVTVFFPNSSPSSLQLEDLSAMITLSNACLRVLKLTTYYDLPEIGLINLLETLWHLETLHILARSPEPEDFEPIHDDGDRGVVIYYPKITLSNALVEILLPTSSNVNSDEVVYLPKLTELSCDGVLTATGSTLVDALEYRWKGDRTRGVEQLGSARILAVGCAKLLEETDILKRIKKLMLQGMDLMVSDY